MPKKILLADDSITIQKVVELTFSDGDYEVTAVNNGARAIQKLSEMRPDIILSDIIMPEKNGYEVCEFVKSHPEYRNIPVVLLTGTFEPFDPDRADKAGCDAVVTKPFESQSLIHKVEELIEQARSAAPATAPSAPAPAPEPEPDRTPEPEPQKEEASPWSDEPAASAPPTAEMPFGAPKPPDSGGETRGFPPTSFGGGQSTPATTQQFTPPAEPESPWNNPPAGGETRAFPKMNFEEMQKMASEREAEPTAPQEDDSPFGAPPGAEQFSGETRAFPKMNFDDMKKLADEGRPSESAEEEAGPEAAGETRAFPQMSFDKGAREESPATATPRDETPWGMRAEKEPAAEPASQTASERVSLSDDQIDQIARRVVQMMSDQVVRNIAWEVIPDMAEMVVKERIRQLESES